MVIEKTRKQITGELESIKAMTERGVKNMALMRNATADALSLWNSQEMERAIRNVERMVAACQALAALEPAQLTFATMAARPESGGSK